MENDDDKFYRLALGWPEQTNLPMFILIDEDTDYKVRDHEIGLEFQINTNEKPEYWNFCQMTLNGELEFDWEDLKEQEDCDLCYKDIIGVRNFASNNSYALKEVADGRISASDFWDICIKGTGKASAERKRLLRDVVNAMEELDETLCEERGMLNEMSRSFPNKTGLPVLLWVDDTGRFANTPHEERIKFDTRDGNGQCPIDMNGGIPNSVRKVNKLSKKTFQDAKLVGEFVQNNKYVLMKILNQEISFADGERFFIKYGTHPTKEQVDLQKRLVDDCIKQSRKSSALRKSTRSSDKSAKIKADIEKRKQGRIKKNQSRRK